MGFAMVAADEPSSDEELGEWLRNALNKTNTDGDFKTVLCPETMWVDGSTQRVVIGQDAVVADLASSGFSGVEPGSVTVTNIVRAPAGELNVETLTVDFKDNEGKPYASIVTLAETGANDGDQQSGGARRLLQFQFDFSTLIVAGECILSMAFVPKT